MHAPSAVELLTVWERGLAESPVRRALLLLGTAVDDRPPERLGELSLGQRNARLLALRTELFGSRFASLAECPACAQPVEMQFDATDIQATPAREPDGAYTLRVDGYEATFRLPTSRDLDHLDAAADVSVNRRHLLARCIRTARQGPEELDPLDLPEAVVRAIGERMAQEDPPASLELALCCPACQHQWQAPLDIVAYLWSELHAWALRMLHQIHTLAAAYGWREADILALSPTRRQAYLDLLGA